MSESGFSLTDHCCRICAGRILERDDVFMCSTCEMRANQVEGVCACGMAAVNGRKIPRKAQEAFRCAINPSPSLANPARIVVTYGGKIVQPTALAS